MSLISGPPSFNDTGGGNTGFWPFQLTIPASMAFCSGLAAVASGCLMAVSRAMGLRWEVTSTTSPARTRPSYSERWVLRSRTDTWLVTISDTSAATFATTLIDSRHRCSFQLISVMAAIGIGVGAAAVETGSAQRAHWLAMSCLASSALGVAAGAADPAGHFAMLRGMLGLSGFTSTHCS